MIGFINRVATETGKPGKPGKVKFGRGVRKSKKHWKIAHFFIKPGKSIFSDHQDFFSLQIQQI